VIAARGLGKCTERLIAVLSGICLVLRWKFQAVSGSSAGMVCVVLGTFRSGQGKAVAQVREQDSPLRMG